MILQPAALLFQGEGTTHELEVRAFDAQGHDVETAALALEFVSSHPEEISISVEDSGRVVARAHGKVGSATLMVRTRGQPGLTSNPVTAVAATLKPGVETVEDARVVFPPPAASRGLERGEALPDISVVDATGHVRIGSFSDEEVLALYKPSRDASGKPARLRIPVVLRGAAPTMGTLLFAREGAMIQGRVVHAEQRGGFSLLQLELVDLAAFFTDLRFRFDSRALQEAGFIEQTASSRLRQGLSEKELIDCDGELGSLVNESSIQLTSWSITPTLRFEMTVSDDALQAILLEAGARLRGVVKAEAGLQSEWPTSFDCELPDDAWETPLISPPGVWALVIGVKGSLQFLVEGEFTLTAGLAGKLKADAEVELPLIASVSWTRAAGTEVHRNGEPTVRLTADAEGALFLDSFPALAYKAEGKLGAYADFKFLAVLGGKFTEVLGNLVDWIPILGGLLDNLEWELITLKMGPEAVAEFSSPLQALNDRSDSGQLAAQGSAELRVLPELVDYLQANYGAEAASDEEPPLSWTPTWELWTRPALKQDCSELSSRAGGASPEMLGENTCGTEIRAKGSQGDWVTSPMPVLVADGQEVAIEVNSRLSPDMNAPEGFVLYRFHEGGLQATDEGHLPGKTPSTGTWKVPTGFCAQAKQGTVELHVVGTNRLLGKIPASSYLGSITVTCASQVIDCTVQGQSLVKGGSVTLAPPECPVSVPLECTSRSATPGLDPSLSARLKKADGNSSEPAWSKTKEGGTTRFSTEVSLDRGTNHLEVDLTYPDPDAPGQTKTEKAAYDIEVACVKKIRVYFPPLPPLPTTLSWGHW
ncbi:MAG: hypothetical protein ABW123_11500, partial [Cystobacter sp.]